MKKCFTYLMAVLLVGLIFASCKSNDNVDSNLLGKWSVTSIETVEDGANVEIKMDGNNYMFFTFSSEGKYFQDVNAYGEKWDFNGTWALESNKLILDKGSMDEQVYTILELTGNKLIIETKVGSQPTKYNLTKVN